MKNILMYSGLSLAGLALLFAVGLFAFLGRVIHPAFWIFDGVLAAGVAAIAVWWRWDTRGAAPAGPDDVETQDLSIEEIANHQPAAPAAPRAHRFDTAWWRRARGRAQRVKEGASR